MIKQNQVADFQAVFKAELLLSKYSYISHSLKQSLDDDHYLLQINWQTVVDHHMISKSNHYQQWKQLFVIFANHFQQLSILNNKIKPSFVSTDIFIYT